MTITALPTPPTRSDPTNFASRADAFLAALPTFADEANALAAAMNLNATQDTSASSIAIGTGAKTFTVSTGKSFFGGMYILIADTAAPTTNAMIGQVTSYSGSTLVVDVKYTIGSGTKTAWLISQSVPYVEHIDGVPVGATTPSTGAFTTLTTTGNVGVGTSTFTFGSGGSGVIVERAGVATVRISNTSSAAVGEISADAVGFSVDARGSAPLLLKQGGTERVRIDSSGNVGVGTTSPVAKLDVSPALSAATIVDAAFFGQLSASNPTVGQGVRLTLSANTNLVRAATITAAHESGTNAHYLAFGTSANGAAPAERLRIDSSGNVGVGVTPSAWRTAVNTRAMQIGNGGALYAQDTGGAYYTVLASNAFQNTSHQNAYINTGFATAYTQVSGSHIWLTAPSGTAGAAITTFTEAMRIDSSGNVGVGTSSPLSTLTSSASSSGASSTGIVVSNPNNGVVNTAARLHFDFANTLTRGAYIEGVNTSGATNASALVFATNPATAAPVERMRIDSSGNVILATTGAGIQFPTANSSGTGVVTSNTMTDYEEGTFTPTIAGTTTAGTGTYTSQIGRYTKIGNRVFYMVNITWTAHTGTGNLQVSGLPFTANATSGSNAWAGVSASNLTFTGQLASSVVPGSATALIRAFASGGAIADVPMDTSASFASSGHYEV